LDFAEKLQICREVGIDEVANLCDESALGERVGSGDDPSSR
jgi:hypothetical protein